MKRKRGGYLPIYSEVNNGFGSIFQANEIGGPELLILQRYYSCTTENIVEKHGPVMFFLWMSFTFSHGPRS